MGSEFDRVDEQLASLGGQPVDVSAFLAAEGLAGGLTLAAADALLEALADGLPDAVTASGGPQPLPPSTPPRRPASIPAADRSDRDEQELDALLGLDYADPESLGGTRPPEPSATAAGQAPESAEPQEAPGSRDTRDTWSEPAPAADGADGVDMGAARLDSGHVDHAATVVDQDAPLMGTAEGQEASSAPDAGDGSPSVTPSEPAPVTAKRAERHRRDTLEDRPVSTRPSPAAGMDDSEIDAILNGTLEDAGALDLPASAPSDEIAFASGPAAAAAQPSMPPPLPGTAARMSVPPPMPQPSSAPPVPAAGSAPPSGGTDGADTFELLIDDEDVLELDDEELEMLDD